MLASWASEAGQFPQFHMRSPVTGVDTTCSEYWKLIITKCYSSESILAIPEHDLQELLDHCEENIEAGSIFSFHLFSTLREGRDRQKNFLGIDFSMNLSSANPGFRILSPDTDMEDAAIQLLIDTAPKELPLRKDYPTAFAFLKAKIKFDTASKYIQKQEILVETTTTLLEEESIATPVGDI